VFDFKPQCQQQQLTQILSMNHLHRNHVLAGLFLLALGFFVVQQSLQWEILGVNGPGVGFFPLAYGSLIVLLAFVLTLKSIGAQLQEKRRSLVLHDPAQTEPPAKVFAALAVWFAFAISIALMKFIGFYLAFGLLLMFMTRVIFSRAPRFVVWSGLLVPAGFFVVFGLLLKVQLPVGIWTGV
jgi:putative tricarboxylic transport membrane protein